MDASRQPLDIYYRSINRSISALAESFNGLYKMEVIRHNGPWRGLDDVEHATLEHVE